MTKQGLPCIVGRVQQTPSSVLSAWPGIKQYGDVPSVASIRHRLRHSRWLGGAQWAGKSSVARALADRFGLQLYVYDLHDARDHHLRALANPERWPVYGTALSADERWLEAPAALALRALAVFTERWTMTLEDVLAMPEAPTLLAEGFGLRPRLVADVIESPRQALFLLPSADFVALQAGRLDRAMSSVHLGTSDPDRAHANRLARDRLLADECARDAAELGLRSLVVTGALGLDEIADEVARHFGLLDNPAL